MEFTAIARRLGLVSATATMLLVSAYAVTLTMGLLSLRSPDQPIRNPMFAILEILVIVMMPRAMFRYSSSRPRCWACSSTERHPAIRQPMSERVGHRGGH